MPGGIEKVNKISTKRTTVTMRDITKRRIDVKTKVDDRKGRNPTAKKMIKEERNERTEETERAA